MEGRGTGCGPIQNPLYTFARRIAEKDFTNGIAAYPRFLRQTFHEWAGHSIQASEWARRYYDELLSRGKRHHAAVRSLLINGSEFCFAVGRIAFLMWKTFTSAPSRTSRGCPIDAVSSCASAVEKSGWLFENFSRLILTQPLGCLTDVLLGADGVSSVIRAGLHGAQPPRPAESALREYERLRIPPNWGSRPQVVAALWRGLKNKRPVA
jgi:hypothetical protein